eukprot:5838886-Prymnesium_polylepis.1
MAPWRHLAVMSSLALVRFGACHAPCQVYHILDQARSLEPTCLDAAANINAFMLAVAQLPGVRECAARALRYAPRRAETRVVLAAARDTSMVAVASCSDFPCTAVASYSDFPCIATPRAVIVRCVRYLDDRPGVVDIGTNPRLVAKDGSPS